MKPPIPENEEARIQSLRQYNILDTSPEQEYDDITLLASQICGTPIALISLVDENRQWFKSKIGVEFDQTPRDDAFCAYTIASPTHEMLVVQDALEDERFAANPLVTSSPSIRFYAAAPLVAPDNHALGALCVFDRKPRQLSDKQLEALEALARQVSMKLELRRMSALLQKANDDLQNLSLTDDLTGVYNRRGFLIHAEQQLKLFRAHRIEGGLYLMMADMDKLKLINDRFGHDEGSAAIIKTAEILRQTFRDSDIIARLGGDEFVALIVNAIENVSEKIAGRLQKSFDEYNSHSEKPYQLSISYGLISVSSEDTNSIEDVMKKADKIMYEHKRSKSGGER